MTVINWSNYCNIVATAGTVSLTNNGFILGDSNSVVHIGTLTLGSGTTIGTLDTAANSVPLQTNFTGTATLISGGTISTIVGDLSDYPVGPGTEVTELANGAVLLSDGSFGAGGLLLLNSGTLALTDASVAPQFANLQQSSGIVGTMLTPEPSAACIAVASIGLLRRRRG